MGTWFLHTCRMLWEKFAAFAERFGKRSLIKQCFWILLFLLAVIFCNLQFIAKSGDAIHKWFLVRTYLEYGTFAPFPPDHHLLRWVLIWPAVAFCRLFGYSIYFYYLYPMIAYCACGLMLFLLARQILDRTMTLLALLLYAFYPVIVHEGTQFLPMVPATFWILLALLLSLRFLRQEQRNAWLMAAAGLSLVAAYGCKESSFYWAPGIFLFCAFAPAEKPLLQWKNMRLTWGMLVLFLVCAGGMIAETLVLDWIYGCRFGRYELLMKSHLLGENQAGNHASALGYVFSFFRQLRWSGKYYTFIPQNLSIVFGCVSAFVLLRCGDLGKRFLAAAFLGAYLCHCYVIFKIHPISYPERVIHRYLIALICVGFLLFCAALPFFLQWCGKGGKWRWALLLSGMLLWFFVSGIYLINARINDGNLLQMERMRQIAGAAFRRGDAVGVLTNRRDVVPDENGRVEPDKWGLLHLRCWADVPLFFEVQKRKCSYEPYDRKHVIVWLVPPENAGKRFLLNEFSVMEIKP